MRSSPPNGILVVDKPRGATSHDVVALVRRALHTAAVGHAGTLDPMATGVLVLAVGEATKLVPWLTAADKSYQATIYLGARTDTLDADGTVVQEVELSQCLRDALTVTTPDGIAGPLALALSAERARTSQTPPDHSAIRTAGQRAYVLARRGEAVNLPPRSVQVRELDLVACSSVPPTLSVSLVVSKGYYVRSLARDLAEHLGTLGHLTHLRRVRSGTFTADEALDPRAPDLLERLQPLSAAACRALPSALLTSTGVVDARHGRRVQAQEIGGVTAGPSAWLDDQGHLVAVGELDAEGHGRVLRGFPVGA